MRCLFVFGCCFVVCSWNNSLRADDQIGVREALDRAATFYHDHCAKHGGYDWRYSSDFRLTEGEGETGVNTIWVQPPGTPAIGMAFLRAHDVTGDQKFLTWAVDAAQALVQGQLQSGGWNYRIEFDPAERSKWGYRDNMKYRPSQSKKNKTNVTTLDDDTTPAATRFLVQVDKRLNFKNKQIHEATEFALQSLLKAQYPNGGWAQNWDKSPQEKSTDDFPIIPASIPNEWSRKWLNDWPGVYYLNDNVTGNMIETMLQAWEVYGDQRYLDCALKSGDFLILAQLPEPQPAWAQQYTEKMHPCWDRKFEPPAISGSESEMAIRSLMLLYHKTGEQRFLKPIPPALAYLKQRELPGGELPRFFEFQTNKPLYFDLQYQLTYDSSSMPTHYGFIGESHNASLNKAFQKLLQDQRNFGGLGKPSSLLATANVMIREMDEHGAWISKRSMKGYDKASPEGVYESDIFVKKFNRLCDYLEAVGQ